MRITQRFMLTGTLFFGLKIHLVRCSYPVRHHHVFIFLAVQCSGSPNWRELVGFGVFFGVFFNLVGVFLFCSVFFLLGVLQVAPCFALVGWKGPAKIPPSFFWET